MPVGRCRTSYLAPASDFAAECIAKPEARGDHPGNQNARLFGSVIRGKSDMRLLHLVPALVLLAGSAAAQPTYPDRPIKMIVPLAAASAVDVAARMLTPKM